MCIIYSFQSVFLSVENSKIPNKFKFIMSDWDYKCSKTPNMSVISWCKDSLVLHHVDASWQFTYKVLIWVQVKYKDFQHRVIRDTGCSAEHEKVGKVVFKRSFEHIFCTKILPELCWNLTKLLGHTHQLRYDHNTMPCCMQIEFSWEIKVLLKGQQVLPHLKILLVENFVCK